MKRTAVVVIALLVLNVLHAGEAKWQPLMDGKTLAGWHPVGDGSGPSRTAPSWGGRTRRNSTACS